MKFKVSLILLALVLASPAHADTGDPQIRTDHPWYPGELAVSTFERLFASQAEAYERATGIRVDSDHQKALAAWFWRNTHYWHAEAGGRDFWDKGLNQGHDKRIREYWNGLFAYGFGLCGTTHSQWTAEFEHLLGHGRGRGVGAAAHNSFEVLLQGGAYGEKGKWALLDHDLSTVIFDDSGQILLGLGEVQKNVDRWTKRDYKPKKQHGWLVCGLHPSDGNSYRKYAVAEYFAGYAGPPPMVHLRRGESLRRYFEPGLEDGKTFVFWGRNYNTDGIPGPERSRTWVNQPEKMLGTKSGTSHQNGQARFANAEYIYRPDFNKLDYQEGVVQESAGQVVFGFQTPYIIGSTPPNDDAWGIYQDGCRNGLVLNGNADCEVSISLNAGRTWLKPRKFVNGLDLTDSVKGRSHYWLRFDVGAKKLRGSKLEIRTVCQANASIMPRLKDKGTTVHFEASGKEVVSIGPELDLAKTFVSAGGFGEKTVTLEVTPQNPLIRLHASAHIASGSPPSPELRYQIEYSLDSGKQWLPVVKNWSIPRRGDEPDDFWSQSLCYGSCEIKAKAGKPVLIRFRNDGGKRYLRAEVHLIEQTGAPDPTTVTYSWSDDSGEHLESKTFQSKGDWQIASGTNVRTHWVEFQNQAD